MTHVGRKLRVIVIDDHKDAADSLAKLVELWGHETKAAYDARVVEVIPGFKPDVILLDIGIPKMDGNKMARHLRQLDCTRDALIIAVTGFHDEANRMLSKEAGIDHYLIKPIDISVLEKLLQMKHTELRQQEGV